METINKSWEKVKNSFPLGRIHIDPNIIEHANSSKCISDNKSFQSNQQQQQQQQQQRVTHTPTIGVFNLSKSMHCLRLVWSRKNLKYKILNLPQFTTTSFQDHWHSPNMKLCYWNSVKRKFFLILLLLLIFYILFMNVNLLQSDIDERIPVIHYSHVPGMKGYLVWNENCKIPNIDPYLPEVMEFFHRQNYEPCSGLQPLTRVTYMTDTYRYALIIVEELIESYAKTGMLECCYQTIMRNGTGESSDIDISLSFCVSFINGTQLPSNSEGILVKCKSGKELVYTNAHAMIPEREEIHKRFKIWKNKNKDLAISVLMIGIDSISRTNLIRAMPKTAQYMYDNEWFEMSGYNKIDDNTFPNFMALLTGLNASSALKKCPPTVLRGLDKCPIIWKTFRDYGYVTAYAEDEASLNTFNYLKIGFEKPPVDYYLRPFLLSAEAHLPIKRKSSLTKCLGFHNSADYVYNYALEFTNRYRYQPYFGLFWTNTFSHNAISDCSAMDAYMVDYMRKFGELGVYENTIVLFLSDHGLRFGPTRKTTSGHLEERLPFLFIWLPPHLKRSRPDFVNALGLNKNRLTNPYDVHMTLKHVLALTGRVANREKLSTSEACAHCQTLFSPVPYNRSCEDSAIEEHWCTCISYQNVYKNSKTVQKLARGIVKYINEYVSNFRNGSFAKLCQPLYLSSINSAHRAQTNTAIRVRSQQKNIIQVYRINFNTKPNNGVFDSTIRYNVNRGEFEVSGEISRLDEYADDSQCVSDGRARKFCSCRKKI